jgi:tRNA pseudouridine55 synthase
MNGIIIVDKHSGCTSFDIIRSLRRITKTIKMGHSGTLDPMATGVLAVFLGSSTKYVKYFMDGDKGYLCEMTLGIRTDTLDASGKTTEVNAVPRDISEDKFKGLFNNFTGEIKQIPPMVSALHHKGRRLYELARDGITVEREGRPVKIHQLKFISIEQADHPKVRFYCNCSKGTYIRSLVSDIGDALGCGAHLSSLRRTHSHPFTIENAHDLKSIEDFANQNRIDEIILDPEKLCQIKKR